MEGNQQKMREALEFAARQLEDATESDEYGDDVVYLVGCMRTVAEACRAALAAPPRNCDVGTPEEQERRYERFCDSHKWVDDEGANACLADCPLYNTTECALHWAQTPYAEEGGNND